MYEIVYDHNQDKHVEINWKKTGREFVYRCSNNHQIHQIIETNLGVIVRPLGDFYSQLLHHSVILPMDIDNVHAKEFVYNNGYL